MTSARETLCDVYKTWRESYLVGLLNKIPVNVLRSRCSDLVTELQRLHDSKERTQQILWQWT